MFTGRHLGKCPRYVQLYFLRCSCQGHIQEHPGLEWPRSSIGVASSLRLGRFMIIPGAGSVFMIVSLATWFIAILEGAQVVFPTQVCQRPSACSCWVPTNCSDHEPLPQGHTDTSSPQPRLLTDMQVVLMERPKSCKIMHARHNRWAF